MRYNLTGALASPGGSNATSAAPSSPTPAADAPPVTAPQSAGSTGASGSEPDAVSAGAAGAASTRPGWCNPAAGGGAGPCSTGPKAPRPAGLLLPPMQMQCHCGVPGSRTRRNGHDLHVCTSVPGHFRWMECYDDASNCGAVWLGDTDWQLCPRCGHQTVRVVR